MKRPATVTSKRHGLAVDRHERPIARSIDSPYTAPKLEGGRIVTIIWLCQGSTSGGVHSSVRSEKVACSSTISSKDSKFPSITG